VTYHEADGVRLLLGDCREVMAQMEPESVSCCVTSPPYWGLRSYSCEPSIWSGGKDCPHTLGAAPVDGESYAGRKRWQHDGVSRQETPEAWVKAESRQKDRQHLKELGERDGSHGGVKASSMTITQGGGATCSLCGAWRGQLGLEPTVQLYIEHTMEWIREVKRVLRKDGVFWLDIGDSRGGSWGNYAPTGKGGQRSKATERWERKGQADVTFCPPTARVLPKSLALIPQRIALACQDDGWIVRSQIIIPSWMPESAKDRPTDSYRTVLMLVKSPRYWYDAQAVRIKAASLDNQRVDRPDYQEARGGRIGVFTDGRPNTENLDGLRNLGDIWSIPPAAYPDSHFATFSIDEPLMCIKASCPPDGTVLDPFIGTGTTAIAARKLGRRCIGIDASEDYLKQAVTRLTVGDSGIRRMVAARRSGAEQPPLGGV